jgi:ComF family protein
MMTLRPVLAAITNAGRSCARGLVDLVLPDVCAGCGSRLAADNGLCPQCSMQLLALIATPYCPRCGASSGPNVPASADGCFVCPEPMPRYSRLVRLGPYQPPLRSVIRQMKFRRQEAMLRRLGELLARAIEGQCPGDEYDLVMPVPMHWRRRLARGGDHARSLARCIARPLDLPVGDELIRIRHTPQQAHLSRTARIENIRGAFEVLRPRDIAGARIILVDDVSTTGATANEAARTLLDAGASRVTLAVVAKAQAARAYARAEV